MVYMIGVISKNEKGTVCHCVKIGYAKDVPKRMAAYQTHNPLFSVFTSEEGGTDREQRLFISLLCNEGVTRIGREWAIVPEFLYCKLKQQGFAAL